MNYIAKFVLNYARQYAVPVAKSVFKAYKDTTAKFSKSKGGDGTFNVM